MKLINIHPKYLNNELISKILSNNNFKRKYTRKYKDYFGGATLTESGFLAEIKDINNLILKTSNQDESEFQQNVSEFQQNVYKTHTKKTFTEGNISIDFYTFEHSEESCFTVDDEGRYRMIHDTPVMVCGKTMLVKGTFTGQNIGELDFLNNAYNSQYLYTLNFSSCGFEGTISQFILPLTNLIYLDLNSNKLTGEIPPEIGNLRNLNFLNLNSNKLTGKIPSEIWDLPNLNILNLNSNKLTGEIPPAIGNLDLLYGLYLANNQLTGEIPPAIGNLKLLNELYLNGNKLIGKIPLEIKQLTTTNIDLSMNMLLWTLDTEAWFNEKTERIIIPQFNDYMNPRQTLRLSTFNCAENTKIKELFRNVYNLRNMGLELDFDDFYNNSNMLQSYVYLNNRDSDKLVGSPGGTCIGTKTNIIGSPDYENYTTILQNCINMYKIYTKIEQDDFNNAYFSCLHGVIHDDQYIIIPPKINIIFLGYRGEICNAFTSEAVYNIINGVYCGKLGIPDRCHIRKSGQICEQHGFSINAFETSCTVGSPNYYYADMGLYKLNGLKDKSFYELGTLNPREVTKSIEQAEDDFNDFNGNTGSEKQQYFNSGYLGDNILKKLEQLEYSEPLLLSTLLKYIMEDKIYEREDDIYIYMLHCRGCENNDAIRKTLSELPKDINYNNKITAAGSELKEKTYIYYNINKDELDTKYKIGQSYKGDDKKYTITKVTNSSIVFSIKNADGTLDPEGGGMDKYMFNSLLHQKIYTSIDPLGIDAVKPNTTVTPIYNFKEEDLYVLK